MRARMAPHCLDIILPRAGSFDRFDAGSFAENLTDFRAVVDGEENPRGYNVLPYAESTVSYKFPL